jgi:hypothetical protein
VFRDILADGSDWCNYWQVGVDPDYLCESWSENEEDVTDEGIDEEEY